jgi:CheY-like chemotaxis protein
MIKTGPIIVIEDDSDDRELLDETFKKLNYPNQVIFFKDGLKALDFIEKTETKPFLILSDVNMPVINGFELKKMVQANVLLNVRCIPYLFFTTGSNKQAVQDAYAMSAQGFFIKPNTMQGLEDTIRRIIEYWQECHAPSQYADE